MKKLEQSIIDKICELNEKGFSSKAIGEYLGKSTGSIQKIMQRKEIVSKWRYCKYNIQKCKYCNDNFKSLKSEMRSFCSSECSLTYLNENKIVTQEIKDKISKSLTHPIKFIKCKCNNYFKYNSNYPNQKLCSLKCAYKYKNKHVTDKTRLKLSTIAKLRHKLGDNSFGWQKRNNLKPSYPESIAIKFFEENNIEYIREVKEGKYFIDFVVFENIAIEIDGTQHEKPERKNSDEMKDKLLNELGYEVIRIKYPNQNIREELSSIIKVYFPTIS